jgi:hypothetical protein
MKTVISKEKLIEDLTKTKEHYEECKAVLEKDGGSFWSHIFGLFGGGFTIASMRIDCKLCQIEDMLLQCSISNQDNVELDRSETILIYELKTLEELKND